MAILGGEICDRTVTLYLILPLLYSNQILMPDDLECRWLVIGHKTNLKILAGVSLEATKEETRPAIYILTTYL